MKTILVLEALLEKFVPVFAEEMPPQGRRKETLVKKTYVVRCFSGHLTLPEDTQFTRIAASGKKPEYQHAMVGGVHVHLVEGLTKEQLEGDDRGVYIEIRLRTVEPLVDRPHAVREYEYIVRAAPAKGKPSAILFLLLSEDYGEGVTIVEQFVDGIELFVHRATDLQYEPLDLPEEKN